MIELSTVIKELVQQRLLLPFPLRRVDRPGTAELGTRGH